MSLDLLPELVLEPGVYAMPEARYHADPVPGGSLSCSGAKLLLDPYCPAIYRWSLDHPRPVKHAFELGTAAHREVLGTGWEYAVWPGDSWGETGAKAFADQARSEGKIPLKKAEHAQIQAMAAAIAADPAARLLLQAENVWPERSFFWLDERWGVWRRARMDASQLAGRVVIADYKTARSADPGTFARDAGNYRYHMQDRWYSRAVTEVLGDADPLFLFIVQEKTEPYLTAVYELEPDSKRAGAGRCERALRLYARCRDAGEWPGYQPGEELVTRIRIPRWAL